MIVEYQSLPFEGKAQNLVGSLWESRASSIDFSNADQIEKCTWMPFPGGVSWTPQQVEANGRKGRRAACVLAEDSLHYRVYDLDHRDRDFNGIEGVDDMA